MMKQLDECAKASIQISLGTVMLNFGKVGCPIEGNRQIMLDAEGSSQVN
jgi:hypothetical protein